MTRDEMVRRLVEFSVAAALGESRRYWLRDLFERGFAGYRNYSDKRLRRELELRGLVQPEDTLVDEEPEGLAWDEAIALSARPMEGRDAE
jgi:hypothetical protein